MSQFLLKLTCLLSFFQSLTFGFLTDNCAAQESETQIAVHDSTDKKGSNVPPSAVGSDDSSRDKKIEALAKASADRHRSLFLLQYKFQPGETVAWDVEHITSTKTQMAGETEETSSRTASRKVWTIERVDSVGRIRFDHQIASVNMWQKIGDQSPIAYNSVTDDKAPKEFRDTADMLGHTLASFTITSDGQIKDRKSNVKQLKFGVGEVVIPLPPQAIEVGEKWSVPMDFSATDESGRSIQLKAHIAYELRKVTDGLAYITFRTEILTPVTSEKVKSQLMQQKTKGFVVFDIKQGRIIRREVEWNEKAIGFEGKDSFLEYLAKMSERIVELPNSTQPTDPSLLPMKVEPQRTASSQSQDSAGHNRKR